MDDEVGKARSAALCLRLIPRPPLFDLSAFSSRYSGVPQRIWLSEVHFRIRCPLLDGASVKEEEGKRERTACSRHSRSALGLITAVTAGCLLCLLLCSSCNDRGSAEQGGDW